MPFFASPVDGAQLHYVDYNPASSPGPFQTTSSTPKDYSSTNITLIFIHGWPMSHLMYEHLLLKLCENHRIRCIASDRRGFGKSEWNGKSTGDITYDTFAQDTAALLSSLDLSSFVIIAASMGCGESLLAHNSMPADMQSKCKGFIWLGPSLPFPLKTDSNPHAPSRELWNAILQGFRDDRVGFTKAAIGGVFGIPFNIGIEVASTILEKFTNIVNQADALALERCVQIITERDFTDDLKAIDGKPVKMLVIHGDNDQSMPASCSASLIPTYANQTKVKIYEKAAHGLYLTHAQQVTDDILAFVGGL